MSEFFNDDESFSENPVQLENGEFRPVEQVSAPIKHVRPQAPQKAPVQQQTYADETYEQQLVNSVINEEDEDYSDVLNDASLRLEQGQLYQLIMNHDIFNGTTADPKAVKAVTRQVRKFAKEQMEIMLGMKRPAAEDTPRATEGSPFNALEIKLLKELAHKMSQGLTSKPEAEKIATGLNPITGSAKAPPKMGTLSPATPKVTQPLAAKPAAPVARPAPKPKKQAESAIKQKEVAEMNADELAAYNKTLTKKYRTAKATSALPMPTFEQEAMLAQQSVLQAGTKNATLMALIDRAVTKK